MILHLDADAFFASCEQAANPALRGKPIVVGGDRGVVTAASYEAKQLGVHRGMPTYQLKQQLPQVIISNSNYQLYEQFSQQIFETLSQVTPCVEAYSIDESFADLTSIDIMRRQSWEQIAQELQTEISTTLNLGVSIGIAPTKVLAKIASHWHKPRGVTVIRNTQDIIEFLRQVPIGDVWGIGWRTQAKMHERNIKTAYDFYTRPAHWIQQVFPKPFYQIHQELHGVRVHHVDSIPKDSYDSISKTRTFYPHTRDPDKLFSYLTRNLDRALEKCRRYNLQSPNLTIFLKTHAPDAKFEKYYAQASLTRPTNLPQEVMPILHQLFSQAYHPNQLYRATGVILHNLSSRVSTQLQLGESGAKFQKRLDLINMVDQIRSKHGHQSVYVGSSYHAMKHISPVSERVGLKVKVSF